MNQAVHPGVVEVPAPAPAVPGTLAHAIRQRTGQNIFRCYQCIKCTSGCPLAEKFDITPSQIIRSLQLNDSRVLHSEAIWLCASCHICAARCPQNIDVATVMKALCLAAKERGIVPAIPDVDRFNKAFLRIVKLFGRVHELTLAAAFNIAMGRPFQDLKFGLEMFRRGRLRIIPRIVRPSEKLMPLADAARKVGYFPGCSADSHAAEYDHTARITAKTLGIELVVPPAWVCCGSTIAAAADPAMGNVQPMRTVTAVERMGLDTVTSPCSACFVRLKASEQQTRRDPRVARAVASETGHTYGGGVKVQHLLDVILERAGLDEVAARVKRPLENLRVACYYGCLMTRPAKVVSDARPEYPERMDELLRALGAEPVAWSSKTECCGNSLSLTRPPLALQMSRKILDNASECGAEAVVTMCPFCHTNLDARQLQMDFEHTHPVLYATQLMTIAFGMGAKAALLEKNFVDPRPLLLRRKLLD